MFAPVLTLSLLLAAGLVLGLGARIRAEAAEAGLRPGRGLV